MLTRLPSPAVAAFWADLHRESDPDVPLDARPLSPRRVASVLRSLTRPEVLDELAGDATCAVDANVDGRRRLGADGRLALVLEDLADQVEQLAASHRVSIELTCQDCHERFKHHQAVGQRPLRCPRCRKGDQRSRQKRSKPLCARGCGRRTSKANGVCRSCDLRGCGTMAAYNRHLRQGETPCEPCRAAAKRHHTAQSAKRRARAAAERGSS